MPVSPIATDVSWGSRTEVAFGAKAGAL